MTTIRKQLIDTCTGYLDENLKRIKICFSEIAEDEVWIRSNEATNSIGNLVLHLNGNITQYILSSLQVKQDYRNRESEFNPENKIEKEELLASHNAVVTGAIQVIRNLDEDELLKERKVQGFNMNGLQTLIHVTEHYSYHTGQITLIVKQLKNKQLNYYKDIDLNAGNEK